ncbi:MAG: EboA domain-containing protein [Planctomycetota bacterium]
MHLLAERLNETLPEDAKNSFESLLTELREKPERLPVLLPRLPRLIGKDWLGGGRATFDGVELDLDAFRACDAAAFVLFDTLATSSAQVSMEQWDDLVRHGDQEERTMLLRAMSASPLGPWTAALLREAQQTNHVGHLVAAAMDSNVLSRAVADQADSGFGQEDCDRMLLKVAFFDLPLDRVLGWESCVSSETSRMLLGLATEREAAGRKVWFDTNRVLGTAPCPGAVGRLLGGIEHGVDEHRYASIRGLASLGRSEFRDYLAERLPREDRPQVRAEIETTIAQLGN